MQALQPTEWQHEPELLEVDAPQPGPGEVLVRVVAAGACHSDLHLFHDVAPGLLPDDPPFTAVVPRDRLDGARDAHGAVRDGSLAGRAVIVHGD